MKRAPSRAFAVALSLCLLGGVASAAGWEHGLKTGESHLVTVSANPNSGIEATMPRHGPYARAIELDRQGRWKESYREYQRASTEFYKLKSKRPRWAKMIEQWRMKAQFQSWQSSYLKRSKSYYSRYRYRRYYMYSYKFQEAKAKHNKWLGIRAYLGRAPPRLAREALAAYRTSLRYRSTYHDARLHMAILLHQLGMHTAGRAALTKVPKYYFNSGYRARYFAYYYTAANDLPNAFKYLKKAMRYSSSTRTYVTRTNHLDPLRSHPKFKKLVYGKKR